MPKAKSRSRVGRGARGSDSVPSAPSSNPRAYGFVLDDGTGLQLDQQPPVAVSKGWGTVPRG
jgi:hypothetical protein